MIHCNIIIQKLDILAEFNAINDGQLYILRGHRLSFRKKMSRAMGKCVFGVNLANLRFCDFYTGHYMKSKLVFV